jgi:hypothetical protein
MDAVVTPHDHRADEDALTRALTPATASVSSVAWAAILVGGVAAAAAAIVLTALGTGLGLMTVSPWANAGVTAGTFGVMTMIWMVVIQWFSAGLGGYMTGRLRTRWTTLRDDEVFFRDTAHGFLAWAVATVVITLMVSSAVFSTASGSGRAMTAIAAGAAQDVTQGTAERSTSASDPLGYYIDTLFRSDPMANLSADADTRGEATRILMTGLRDGDLAAPDRAYLAQMVAGRTGVTAPEAQKRVDDAIGQIKAAEGKLKETADAVRKVSATIAILTALSLLIGAFIASAAAALGGRLRDES